MRRQLLVVLTAINLIVSNQSHRANSSRWKLVWSDEFDGAILDRSKWYHLVDCSGRGNRELQCYTNREQNVQLRDGHLVLRASLEPDYVHESNAMFNRTYTSGRVHASGRGWRFGKFEARARLPKGKHLWPAIWLVPTRGVYGPWPQSGEIDIVEGRGQRPSQLEGTIHFGNSRKLRSKLGSAMIDFGVDFSSAFHVFTFEWTRTSMSWAIDGVEFFNCSLARSFNLHSNELVGRNGSNGINGINEKVPKPRSIYESESLIEETIKNNLYHKNGQPFDEEFKWILNVAVGGNYFPKSVFGELTEQDAKGWEKPSMEVDYVRVYEEVNENDVIHFNPVHDERVNVTVTSEPSVTNGNQTIVTESTTIKEVPVVTETTTVTQESTTDAVNVTNANPMDVDDVTEKGHASRTSCCATLFMLMTAQLVVMQMRI